jgi:hypothetical protein
MKICTKCKIEKDESEFCKCKNEKDGLYCYCKECRRQHRQELKRTMIKKMVETKTCTKCKIEKNESEFSKDNYKKDGLQNQCKECQKQYRRELKRTIIKKMVETKTCTKCKIEKKPNEFSKDNYRKDGLCSWCKECRNQHHWINRERDLTQQKQYEKENRGKISAHKKQYRKTHRKEINQRNNEKRANNICFRLRGTVSASINNALRRNNGGKNGGSILNFLPFTIQELKDHLEKQFDSWMSWNNYGKYNPDHDTWQIDHIIPHSSFHYETMDCDEFRECWALKNLRPLETIENVIKGNKPLANTTTE